MFRLLVNSVKMAKTSFYFCNQSKKQHILQMTRQLLSQHHQYKPWKNVRIIHSLTMARYDPDLINIDQTSKWREDQPKIHEIINSLSGQLHLLPHKQLNMLLEILKERGYTYNREEYIYRALNKQIKMLFGKQYQANLLLKTFNLLRSLNVPKMNIIKMLQLYLAIGVQQEQKNEALGMSQTNIFKFAIKIIEEPFIGLPITRKFVQKVIKQNVNRLQNLCSLYHISRILTKCLATKVQYQYTKSNARQILFNPYQNIEEEENKAKQSQSQAKPDENQQIQHHNSQLKLKLNQMSNQIIKLFSEAVDSKKLQNSIIKSVESDIEPLNKQSLLLAADIVQLKPILQKYLLQNIDKLTPVQFIYLIKRCSKQSTSQYIQTYMNKLGKFMNIQETAYLLLEANRFFHQPIKVSIIQQLIQTTNTINYDEFIAITRLVELLSSKDQCFIPKILEAIKSKLPTEKNDQKSGN